MNVELVTQLILTNRRRLGRKTNHEITLAVDKYNRTAQPDYRITSMQVHKKLGRYYENEKKKKENRILHPFNPNLDNRNTDSIDSNVIPQPLTPIYGRPLGTTLKEQHHRRNVASHFKDIVSLLYKNFVQGKLLQKRFQLSEQTEGDPADHGVQMIRNLIKEGVSNKTAYEAIYNSVYETYKTKYGFMENTKYSSFNFEAVRSRVRRNNLEQVSDGQNSPVADVEPLIAQLCVRASQANHSLSGKEVRALANSLLEGSPCEKKIIQWKLNNCPAMKDRTATNANLGDSWFRGFLKRYHELHVVTQHDVNVNRDSWCTYHNLRDMYDILFQYWNKTGYCKPLEMHHWQDRFGNKVDVHHPQRMGRKVTSDWIHGNRMLCFDEVRSLFVFVKSFRNELLFDELS